MRDFVIELSKETKFGNYFNKAVGVIEDKVLKKTDKKTIYFFSTEEWAEGEVMADFDINDYELDVREVEIDIDGKPTKVKLTYLGDRKGA